MKAKIYIYKMLFFASLAPGVVYLAAVALELMDISVMPEISYFEAFLYALLIFFVELPLCAFFYFRWIEHQEKYVPTNKEKLKKARHILAADFKKDMEECTFFMNHDYDHPYTQSQWAELFKELQAKNDPQALIPMYNAVAVNSHGTIVRRGLEKSLDGLSHFYIGSTDKLSDKHAVEPYTYKDKYTLLQCAAFYEAHPNWERAWRSVRSSTGSYTGSYGGSYAGSSATSGPTPRRGLSPAEKAEMDRAKRRYEEAVARASYHRGDKVKTSVHDDAEKRAYAEYLRVMAKYAGRG